MLDPKNHHDAEIQKMRERAMKAEVARYLSAEAKFLLEDKLREASKEAGFDFDKLRQKEVPPRTKIQVAADTADIIISLPGMLIKLSLYGIIIYVAGVFIYGLMFGMP